MGGERLKERNGIPSAERTFYVYMLASLNGTLYVGVTGNLAFRLHQHRTGVGNSFTARYKVRTLVYFEAADSAIVAIAREKEIKKWRREKKAALIESVNPSWNDLVPELWPGAEI